MPTDRYLLYLQLYVFSELHTINKDCFYYNNFLSHEYSTVGQKELEKASTRTRTTAKVYDLWPKCIFNTWPIDATTLSFCRAGNNKVANINDRAVVSNILELSSDNEEKSRRRR